MAPGLDHHGDGGNHGYSDGQRPPAGPPLDSGSVVGAGDRDSRIDLVVYRDSGRGRERCAATV